MSNHDLRLRGPAKRHSNSWCYRNWHPECDEHDNSKYDEYNNSRRDGHSYLCTNEYSSAYPLSVSLCIGIAITIAFSNRNELPN